MQTQYYNKHDTSNANPANQTVMPVRSRTVLLAIDIGNTSTGIAFYDGTRRVGYFRAQSDAKRTPDEWNALLSAFVAHTHSHWTDITRVVLCSVVPPITDAVEEVLLSRVRHNVLNISAQMEIGMALRYDRDALGADRFANAAGAFLRNADTNWILCDFGTATKIEAVLAGGVYAGGVILPGIGISCDALFARAAKLSQIELTAPPSVIGSNTIEALQSGILNGFGAQADGLIARFIKELGLSTPPRIIATGGYAEQIAPFAQSLRDIHPFWTLDSLRRIADRVGNR